MDPCPQRVHNLTKSMANNEEDTNAQAADNHLQNGLQNDDSSSASEGNSNKINHTEKSSPEFSSGKWRWRKKGESMKKYHLVFQSSVLPVQCGTVKGSLYKDKLAAGSSQRCIEDDDGKWFTPSEFEMKGSYGSCKSWKRTIRCKGFPLEKLIEKGYLNNPPRIYHKKEKRENPSDPETHQPPEFQASDATAALATQEPSGTARKRTSEPRSLASFLSSSSLAASPAAPASRREATPSPPPVLSSEAAPVLSKLQCETRVVLRRLSLTEVPSASNNSPEPPQEGPKSVSTRISPRRFHPYVRLHTLSSSMGRAILSGQRRMEQQFLKTLGKLPDLQVKLRAIQGHLHGLRKQQKSLRVALNRWNRCDMVLEFEGLQRQMGTIISHQQVLLTSMLQILGALGFCPERLCSPATVH